LSEHEHYIEGNHNAEYDHEAFLGDEATQFDDLTPEESKRRLGWAKWINFKLYYHFNIILTN